MEVGQGQRRADIDEDGLKGKGIEYGTWARGEECDNEICVADIKRQPEIITVDIILIIKNEPVSAGPFPV